MDKIVEITIFTEGRSSVLRLNEMCSSMVKLWIPETIKSFVVEQQYREIQSLHMDGTDFCDCAVIHERLNTTRPQILLSQLN